ncbi:MAG: N-formylglutamate amidohydrolase [Hyphomonadaceae bacterium]|nr:N-formylglutamate amidohydrolase [Hyphomonadaceae bacterium]
MSRMHSAYRIIEPTRDVPLFIFGDHASRYIPGNYGNLGLAGNDMTRHIAWDIGSASLIRAMADFFGCRAQLANFSRLLIDPNRSLDADSLILEVSDGTVIPGNWNLSMADKRCRIDEFYQPYHDRMSDYLKTVNDPLVISIHSFTPQPLAGATRHVDIGLLVKHDELSARQFQRMFMQLGQGFSIGMNEPYSAHDFNHTIDTHVAPRGLRHLAIEVNQRLVDTEYRARNMGRILAEQVEPIVNRVDISIGD